MKKFLLIKKCVRMCTECGGFVSLYKNLKTGQLIYMCDCCNLEVIL